MHSPSTSDLERGSAVSGRHVVAVVDPRPVVRTALVHALDASGAGFVVHEAVDTTASSLRSVGPVDVVVASDAAWARGIRRLDPEGFDVGDLEALASAVLAVAASESSGAASPAGVRGVSGGVAVRPLTDRESSVLDAFARGLTAAEVAVELGISPSAVASAKRRVLAKLDVATTVEALRRTGRSGTPTISEG